MPNRLLDQLERRILLFDGAMGTLIQAMDLSVDRDYLGRENCSEILVRTRPETIQAVHESYLQAGADVVETDTFGANRLVFAEFDAELAEWSYQINREAAEIARAACERFHTSDKPRFVVGSMGPGTRLVSLGHTTWDAMLESYVEQARGLIDGGVDALLVETCQDLLQVKCAVNACLDALAERSRGVQDIPIMVSATIETTGTMLVGSELSALAYALAMFPVSSLGLNCATGPAEMAQHLRWLSRHWPRHLSVMPSAGLPRLVNGKTEYPLEAEAFAEAMMRFVEVFGADMVGGCCGTTPEHIRLLREAVGRRPGTRRQILPPKPGCSSLYHHVEYDQQTSFLIVAERTNAHGSRRFKRLLQEEDYDGLSSMAKEELRCGAHLLDVCVDCVGRDGVKDAQQVVSRFVRHVDAPLMIDSTEARVIEAALKLAGGKCIVNSIHLQDGEKRFDDVCPLLRRYGAACVALTIDESGMAKTARRKLAVAGRLHDLYVDKWGFDERDLLIDPLTFTLATGNDIDRRLALETLEAVGRIRRQYPRCGILLGVSNVSFGLKPAARVVLNSVFLHEAVRRGLTAAIVHVSQILPRNRIDDARWDAAQWLIFDRRCERRPENMPEDFDPLLHFIGLFPEGGRREQPPTVETLPLEKQLRCHIIDGDDRDLAIVHHPQPKYSNV